jgi:hypothetical protein
LQLALTLIIGGNNNNHRSEGEWWPWSVGLTTKLSLPTEAKVSPTSCCRRCLTRSVRSHFTHACCKATPDSSTSSRLRKTLAAKVNVGHGACGSMCEPCVHYVFTRNRSRGEKERRSHHLACPTHDQVRSLIDQWACKAINAMHVKQNPLLRSWISLSPTCAAVITVVVVVVMHAPATYTCKSRSSGICCRSRVSVHVRRQVLIMAAGIDRYCLYQQSLASSLIPSLY